MSGDARLYRNVHQVLLAGVVISNALFALGLGLVFVAPAHAKACLELATVLLIATPVVRVVIALYDFAAERDARFAVVSAIVLAVLGATIALSRLGFV